MQRDRMAVARTWLRNAARDVSLARLALNVEPALAAFHAQQAADKSLKGAAIAATDDHARSHSCTLLMAELRSHGVRMEPQVDADARALDLYYLASRYPDAVADNDPGDLVPREDAVRALERCDRVVEFARAVIESEAKK